MSSITDVSIEIQGVGPDKSETTNIFPVATTTTNNELEQTQAERINKFKYDEFAGHAGERYLDAICQKILPYALWRTWMYAVEFQAPGLPCYVGATRIAERVKPQVRKIEIDLQAFRERGLVHIYADRIPIVEKDGSIRHQAVTIKDWTALYDLAHEYHIWTLSPHYIPAERVYLELLLTEPELLQKLLRFDNYRRIVTTQKPGPKPQARQLTYQCTLPPTERAEEKRTSVPNANNYLQEQLNTYSPYRESSNHLGLTDDSTSSNSLEKEEFVAAKTIRSSEPKLERRTETEQIESKSNTSNPTPPKDEVAREDAKDAEEYNIDDLKKNPLALAMALADMVQREKAGQQAQGAGKERRKKPEKRPRQSVPDWFIRRVVQEAQELGDDPKVLQSVITRLSKVYLTALQTFTSVTQDEVMNRLNDARKATGRHASKIQKRGANGHKNYMPYLIECFINSWQFREEERAFIDSDEPLYQDSSIADFIDQLCSEHERSGSRLAFEEWLKQRRTQKQSK